MNPVDDALSDFILLVYVAFAVGAVGLVAAGVAAGVLALRRGSPWSRAAAIVLAVLLGTCGAVAALAVFAMADESEPAWVFAYWGAGWVATWGTAVFDLVAALRVRADRESASLGDA